MAVQEVDHLLPRSGGTDQTALLGAAPRYPAHRPRWRLDHVLLLPGGDALRLRETATPRLGGSDHLAVCAEVRGTAGA